LAKSADSEQGARAQAKPSKAQARRRKTSKTAQDMAQGRKTWRKPSKTAQDGARRARKRRAIDGAPLI